MKQLMSKIKSVAVAALTMGLALGAQAATISYLSPVTNTEGKVQFDANGNVLFTTLSAECTSLKSCDKMKIDGDGWYQVSENITISDVLKIEANVKIVLCDNTTLTVGRVEVKDENDGELTIYAQSTNETTMGKLDAAGQQDKKAGIGGDNRDDNGTITINGGNIYAKGGMYAAGIGGGHKSTGKNITINGGKVKAWGVYGAGIGGGYYCKGKNITINGGSVEALGGRYSAGIGGGYDDDGDGITINGGNVTAYGGGDDGAGIGGGASGKGNNITINGGSVTAWARAPGGGSTSAAGIGSGYPDSAKNITINGGTVNALGHGAGPGIGGCSKAEAITINGGDIAACGGAAVSWDEDNQEWVDHGAAGIGGCYSGSVDGITINGGKIDATGRKPAAAIGSACKECKNIKITGGTVKVQNGGDAMDIGSSYDASSKCADVTITGGSINAKEIGNKAVNASGAVLKKTMVMGVDGSPAVITGLGDYGVDDLYPDEQGTLYLWLPEGRYAFHTQKETFEGNAGDTITSAHAYYGMSVNATDIGECSGTGWTFDTTNHTLTLSSAMAYNLSGADRSGLVRVVVTASDANVTLDNLTLPFTRNDARPIEFAGGTTNSLILTGVNTVYGLAFCSSVFVGPGAKVTLSGTGDLVGNLANSRGFQVDDGGTLVMESGTIRDYSVGDGGSGVYCRGTGSTFTMNGGTISGCSTSSNGGAIHITDGGSAFTMNGGTISGCSASCWGGAIYNKGTLTINGGTISGCSAGCGGALFNDGTTDICGGTFTGNSAPSDYGGCIYCHQGHAVFIYGGYFANNTAPAGLCNLYVGHCYEQNGRLYGGVFAADPTAATESSGCLALQGKAAVTKVGNFYVVGTGVQSQNGALTAGTYTFNPKNLEYENAGITVQIGRGVQEQSTDPKTYVIGEPDAEFRVNNVRVKDGPGEGWSFDMATGKLVLSNDMTYVLSGYCNESYAVDVTANATVEFSNVRIHAGNLGREVFNITGSDVTLTLGGSNEVYTTDGNAAFGIASGAKLTLNGGDGVLWGGAANGSNSRCVSVADGGVFVMNGGEIRGYTATTDGSVVLSAGEATINGGTIAGNGGTTLLSGAVAVRGGVFEDNGSTTLTTGTGLLYGGVSDAEPAATAVADGYAAKPVGDLYVIGQGVTVENGQLMGGTFTFDPKGDEYAAAGLTCAPQCAVVPQGTDPETYAVQRLAEFRVNDELIGKGSGEGWSLVTNETAKSGCLTLSEPMAYTLTGYSDLTLTVDVLSNATVTLDGIRIRADKPARDIFRVFGDDTTFVLSGTNTVYANDGNAAIGVTGGACLTVESVEVVEKVEGALVGGRTSGIDGRCFNVSGELVLESGTIRDYYAANGGAIYNGGTLEMDGGMLTNCLASARGGAIYNTGTLTINGGTISGCSTSTDYWGGGALFSEGTASIYGGTFTGNSAPAGYGGCIYCYQGHAVSIYGGYFANNTAPAGRCNLYFGGHGHGCYYEKNGRLYGGVFATDPLSDAESRGCLVRQGYAQAVEVGDLWVVGTDVAGAGNTLSYGTYTFDPQEDEYAAVGLGIAERHIVTAQGTDPETYFLDWNYTGLKIGYLDDDGNIVNVKDAIEGGTDWSIYESTGLVTLNAARSDDEPYVIMGQNTRKDLDLGVAVDANNAWVLFTNATIATTAKAALAVDAANVTLLMAGDSKLTSKESDALTCSSGKSVTFLLADDDAAVDSVTLTVSSIGGEGTVSLGGESYGYDDKCGTIEVTGDIDVGTLTVKNGILKVEGGIAGDTIAIQGGRTTVEGKSGIVGGTVTIEGGTIVADTIKATGEDKSVTITGGSVKAGKVTNPKNDGGDTIWCVTVPGVTVTVDAISCGYMYGDNDIYPIDEEIYLWMPNSDGIDDPWYIEVANDNGWYEDYYADVNDAPTVAYQKDLPDIMLYVNGEQVNEEEGHNGWSYDANNCVLTLDAEGTNSYVITGMEMDGRVRIVVAGSCDVSFTGQLGTQEEMTQDENLIVIGDGTEACMVNMEFADTTSFKVMPDGDGNFVAAVGVEQYATLNIVGKGTAYNFAVDLRGEGDDKGKITMADPTSITYTTEESAKAAAATIQPVADETYFPGIDQDAYATRVKAVAVETSSGTWTLDYQISETGTNDIVNAISSVEASSSIISSITNATPSATFYPVAGFYYGLPGAVEVENVEDATTPAWYRGQQDTPLTVEGPTFTDTDKAFYQLRATLTP